MAGIKIRVAASLDANAAKVFEPLVQAAERARKSIDKSLNEAAKSPKKVAAAAKQEGDALERELKATANRILSDEEKSQKARTRVVERESKARAAAEAKAITEVDRAEKSGGGGWGGRGGSIGVGRRAAIGVSRGSAIAYGIAGRGVSMGAGLLGELASGVGIETSLAPHMANAMDFQQRMGQVVSAGYIPGAAGAQGKLQDSGQISKEVYAAANKAGYSGNDVAEGLQKFVGLTGDLETGRKTLEATAVLARATGSDFVSMAEASAEVSNHLGNVPDKAEAVSSVMRVIAGQGKMGALEIKDFAKQMAKIAANAPMFEGKISDTIGDLGLIAQESKMGGGSASASQAATSVMAFARNFSKKTTFKHWQAAGINPFTDESHTKLRSPEELILEAVKYSKGDQTKLAQLFPSAMAARAVKPFAAIYSEHSGTEQEKLKAVADEFDRMRKASLTTAEITRAFGVAMDTDKTRVQQANNKLDDMAGVLTTALIPALAGLAPMVEAMTPAFADAIGWLAKLVGIKPNEDADARKRRQEIDKENAAQAALDQANGAPVTLATGKKGAVASQGEIDAQIVEDRKQHAKELAQQIATKKAEYAHHQALLDEKKNAPAGTSKILTDEDASGGWGTKSWLSGTQSADEKTLEAKHAQEARDLGALQIEQNKTNGFLQQITQLVATGVIKISSAPPVTSSPSGGTMPADSPDPQ